MTTLHDSKHPKDKGESMGNHSITTSYSSGIEGYANLFYEFGVLDSVKNGSLPDQNGFNCSQTNPEIEAITPVRPNKSSPTAVSLSGRSRSVMVRPGLLGHRRKDTPMVSKEITIIRRSGNISSRPTTTNTSKIKNHEYESLASHNRTESRLQMNECFRKIQSIASSTHYEDDQCNVFPSYCVAM
mmetsp:Transcript_18263/g.44836  ORF Transcript_18263/g.44836 Transcript_18263/m.44836 type:complete len:185 (+) Transcript_18263:206-760(+)